MICQQCRRDWCKCALKNNVCPLCDGRYQRRELRMDQHAEARARAREPQLNHGVSVTINGITTHWGSIEIDGIKGK